MGFKRLNDLLRGVTLNNDNLHRIAISNIMSGERQLMRWWHKKYNQPPKPINEYTHEELVIEMLEDFYDNNRSEAQRFLDMSDQIIRHGEIRDWDGKVSDRHEQAMKDYWSKKPQVDITKYQSEKDKELTPEEEQALLDNLGFDLPKSKKAVATSKGPRNELQPVLGEFEENFGDDQ